MALKQMCARPVLGYLIEDKSLEILKQPFGPVSHVERGVWIHSFR